MTDRLTLGASGLRVSPFCLGLVGSPEVLTTAYDAGINFFFLTADMHWPLYEPVREGLRRLLRLSPAIRDEIVVAVVSYVTQPEFCHDPFEEVLDVLPELGRIDVAVIGGAYAADFPGRLREYSQHRTAGVRALGATFHERAAAVEAINEAAIDVAFIRYNPAHAGAEREIFPLLNAERKTRVFNFQNTHGYVAPERLGQLGLPPHNWRPGLTDHYRFALTPPYLDGLLCAFEEVVHVEELQQALSKGPLSPTEATYLKRLCALDRGQIVLESDA